MTLTLGQIALTILGSVLLGVLGGWAGCLGWHDLPRGTRLNALLLEHPSAVAGWEHAPARPFPQIPDVLPSEQLAKAAAFDRDVRLMVDQSQQPGSQDPRPGAS